LCPAEEVDLVFLDGLSSAQMMLVESLSLSLLLLLICSSIDDKKGVLKVNCAEE
jgi:hypothetical protein